MCVCMCVVRACVRSVRACVGVGIKGVASQLSPENCKWTVQILTKRLSFETGVTTSTRTPYYYM